MRAFGGVHREKFLHFLQHLLEAAASYSRSPSRCCRASDRTTKPPCAFPSSTARISAGRCASTLPAPKRQISVMRPGSRSGSRMSRSFKSPSALQRRPALQRDRVFDAAREFDMGMVGLARAVADPDQVAGGVVPIAARGIDARHRLLVSQAAAPRGWCRNRSCAFRDASRDRSRRRA